MGQAEKDLPIRLKLEQRLHRQLRVIDREIVIQFVNGLQQTGTIIDVSSRALEPLMNMLRSSYHLTGDAFDSFMRAKMPVELAITSVEEATISTALSEHFAARAPTQADLILQTTQKNMMDAVRIADEAALELGITSPVDKSRMAGSILDRKLIGRESGIAQLEVQATGEAAKLTEFEVLSGASKEQLSVLGGEPPIEATKTWTTMGDQRVRGGKSTDRFNHINADEQQIPGSEPFQVSGEQLNTPGDTSLGASIGNVARCRCSTRFNPREVIDARRRAA